MATFILMSGMIAWVLVPSKNIIVAIATAIIAISSCATGYFILFDSQVSANRILSSDQVMHTELKRSMLIHYTTWLDPSERIEPALAFLNKDEASIHEDWDKLGFAKQMDMITTFNRKGLITYRIRDAWLSKTLQDMEVDIDLFLNQAIDPHERNDFIRAITLQTDSAKVILAVSKWGLGASFLCLLIGLASISIFRDSAAISGFLSVVMAVAAITMPLIPLILLSGITFTL